MIHRGHARLAAVLLAGAAATATTAVLATTGSAQTRPTTTLHLVGTQAKHVGFAPRHEPRPGDSLGVGEKLSGDDTGISRSICTIVGGRGGLPCTVWIKLSRGTLTAEGMLPERAHQTPIAITGGTGAYDGARGTARVTDISRTKTRIAVTLVP